MEERFPDTAPYLEAARHQLQDLMRERGVSITGLCRRIGWTRTYFHDLFRRRMDLKLVHILAILDEMDIAPSTFFAELTRRYGELEAGETPESQDNGESEVRPG